ncbi:MAG: pyridoxamine 5'-phosphate oxidase family protein [Bacilli bacterium]|jgi:nitroimidazol reductase NimA-like FMN-containing flavoprotein (pyridoxamine 5'-phosphate oxidase superfamily)|nr:pyridoxamine 5'-phosphate oxidase family protein [Bacilli bacterium]
MDYLMIKENRKLSEEKSIEILNNASHGILSTIDEDNQPYGVPLSYVLINKTIYFHCANNGHKLHNINYNNKVSFTVVSNDYPVIDDENDYTTRYASVIVFGKAYIVLDKEEKIKSLKALTNKYFENMSFFDDNVKRFIDATTIVAIDIDKISGKSNIK